MEINKVEYEIGVYDLEGHFIDSSDSWEYLEKEFGLTKIEIRNYKTKVNIKIKNYQLVFKPISAVSSDIPSRIGDVTKEIAGSKMTPVAKYYKDRLISVYKNITEASNLTKINKGGINKSCNRGHKAAGAFTFKYIE